MARIIGAPSRYIQGRNALGELTKYTENLGKKMLVLVSAGGQKRAAAKMEAAFAGSNSHFIWEIFGGECSKQEIERIRRRMEAEQCDLVVGIGGGKILDTAKAVAYYAHVPSVCVPTAASTDAPCSALSVLYSEDGQFDSYLFLPSNPDIVLLDTDMITAAPTRLLVAGMGDALATYFETRACHRSNAISCMGGTVSKAAMALSELCYQTLLEDGVKAKLAVEVGACTQAVENIIEANTYLSGIGFESGGLAGAHAIHNGLTCIEDTHAMYHGEKVAFGVLTQLVLENVDDEELEEVLDFCASIGLPITLADLGISTLDHDQLRQAAALAAAESETIHNLPFTVTADDVYHALLAADAIGRAYYEAE